MPANEGMQVLRNYTMSKGDQLTISYLRAIQDIKPIDYTVTLDGWQLVALKIMCENYIEGEPMPNIHIESLQGTLNKLNSATS